MSCATLKSCLIAQDGKLFEIKDNAKVVFFLNSNERAPYTNRCNTVYFYSSKKVCLNTVACTTESTVKLSYMMMRKLINEVKHPKYSWKAVYHLCYEASEYRNVDILCNLTIKEQRGALTFSSIFFTNFWSCFLVWTFKSLSIGLLTFRLWTFVVNVCGHKPESLIKHNCSEAFSRQLWLRLFWVLFFVGVLMNLQRYGKKHL